MIVTLLPNRTGRDFILGDLHGAFPFLQALLSHAHFDEHHDRLIATGDLFDRGPAALDCLTLPDKPWFYAVRGNHEDALLAWYFAPDAGAKNRVGKDRPARW
jgi:serine/threonine protein phosphatase 1